MPTNVLMPQMGESIAEGTIVRWIKQVGEPIDKDEPLFEISTDKVDAEIPSPGAGFLVEITVKEGETVPVNSVVAVIGETARTPGTTGTAGTAGTAGTTPDAAALALEGLLGPGVAASDGCDRHRWARRSRRCGAPDPHPSCARSRASAGDQPG